MKRYLTPITAAAITLALGAAGGAMAASSSQPSRQLQARCAQRAAIRTKLRTAFKAERQKENACRLDPSKREEIAKPILDQAVTNGDLEPQAADRILTALGKNR
jgi:ribosomal protein S20